MNDLELVELDNWLAEHLMGWKPSGYTGDYDPPYLDKDGKGCGGMFCPTRLLEAAMMALMECYKKDPNDTLPALANFLIRPEFKERTLTPEKVCRFIKLQVEQYPELFTK